MVDLKTVQVAIDNYRLISFNYTDREGNPTFRQGEPYEIRHGGNGTDVFVWDTEKDEIRRFKSMRMNNLTVFEETFLPRF